MPPLPGRRPQPSTSPLLRKPRTPFAAGDAAAAATSADSPGTVPTPARLTAAEEQRAAAVYGRQPPGGVCSLAALAAALAAAGQTGPAASPPAVLRAAGAGVGWAPPQPLPFSGFVAVARLLRAQGRRTGVRDAERAEDLMVFEALGGSADGSGTVARSALRDCVGRFGLDASVGAALPLRRRRRRRRQEGMLESSTDDNGGGGCEEEGEEGEGDGECVGGGGGDGKGRGGGGENGDDECSSCGSDSGSVMDLADVASVMRACRSDPASHSLTAALAAVAAPAAGRQKKAPPPPPPPPPPQPSELSAAAAAAAAAAAGPRQAEARQAAAGEPQPQPPAVAAEGGSSTAAPAATDATGDEAEGGLCRAQDPAVGDEGADRSGAPPPPPPPPPATHARVESANSQPHVDSGGGQVQGQSDAVGAARRSHEQPAAAAAAGLSTMDAARPREGSSGDDGADEPSESSLRLARLCREHRRRRWENEREHGGVMAEYLRAVRAQDAAREREADAAAQARRAAAERAGATPALSSLLRWAPSSSSPPPPPPQLASGPAQRRAERAAVEKELAAAASWSGYIAATCGPRLALATRTGRELVAVPRRGAGAARRFQPPRCYTRWEAETQALQKIPALWETAPARVEAGSTKHRGADRRAGTQCPP